MHSCPSTHRTLLVPTDNLIAFDTPKGAYIIISKLVQDIICNKLIIWALYLLLPLLLSRGNKYEIISSDL